MGTVHRKGTLSAANSWFSLFARVSEHRRSDDGDHFPQLFFYSRHVFILFSCLAFFFFLNLRIAPPFTPCGLVGLSNAAYLPGDRIGHVTGCPIRYPTPLETMMNQKADIQPKQSQSRPSAEGREAGRERAAVKNDFILEIPAVILRPPRQSPSASEVTEACRVKRWGERERHWRHCGASGSSYA